MKMIITVFLFIAGIIFVLLNTFFDLFSSCPLKLRFEMETACYLRDRRGDNTLIELFRQDEPQLWLAIINQNGTQWLKHPYGVVKNYSPRIPKNEIKFSDDKRNLLVNGEVFAVEVQSQRPSGVVDISKEKAEN
jgi:hypothetical protein